MESYRLAPFGTRATVNVVKNGAQFSQVHKGGRLTPIATAVHSPSQAATSSASPNVQDLTQQELRFRALFHEKLGYQIVDCAGDGNCLFRAVAHQVYGDQEYHHIVRDRCMTYIESELYFFQSYIAGDVHAYVQRMRQHGEWGDHVEIQAMSEIYGRPIHVYAYSLTPLKIYHSNASNTPHNSITSSSSTHVTHTPLTTSMTHEAIRLSYHFNSHYNSVIAADHHASLVTSPPGVLEDEVISKSVQRGLRGIDRVSCILVLLLSVPLYCELVPSTVRHCDP